MCVVENILRKINVLITAKHKNVDFKVLQMLVIPMEARTVRVHTCVCVRVYVLEEVRGGMQN